MNLIIVFFVNLNSCFFFALKIRNKDSGARDVNKMRVTKILQSFDIAKHPRELVYEDMVGVEFTSTEEAKSFYHIY